MTQTTPAAKPLILAPAGDIGSFLAALAAGADAVYAGLKHFSARMQAGNFSLSELSRLKELSARRGARLFVAFNVMAKPNELVPAGHLLERLARTVNPDALIVQDPGLCLLARQAGYEGPLHLSTLAGLTHPEGLALLHKKLDVSRVVLPRELSIDEIKAFAAACPPGLDLECFVHGALCYAVSGRCWWSSYMGGKSGLRGRCVQPCRRLYTVGKQQLRAFSCRDLSLDVLARTLLPIPQVAAWKIEGRKKGPHYVYHVVAAYRSLRDGEGSPESKKAALDYLDLALGRPTTHYGILPQRPHPAVTPEETTTSGRFIAATGKSEKGLFPIRPREPLLKFDLLRVGSEEDPWHQTVPVTRSLPKGGRLDIRSVPGHAPRPGTPVFLVDRREPGLMAALRGLQTELDAISAPEPEPSHFSPRLPSPAPRPAKPRPLTVYRSQPKGKLPPEAGLWLAPAHAPNLPKPVISRLWLWLPPVLWPDEAQAMAETLADLIHRGARRLVLGSLSQAALLPDAGDLEVWAGPFCNLANPLALAAAKSFGCSGAFVSPELDEDDLLALPALSPIPLGLVTAGHYPLCLSRTKAENVPTLEPLISPKGEAAWLTRHGGTYHLYPAWPLDLSAQTPALTRAGYSLFAHLVEPVPRSVQVPTRASTFNWSLKLL